MPASQSLDDLIAKHAAEFAEHVRAVAKMADSEMDVQVEAAAQLRFAERAAGITLTGRHNCTIASGRPDSVYNRVIVEYKNPSSPADRIGETLDSPGSKKVVEQIKNRFRELQTELRQPINSLFGVGCDGNRFIFVRWRDSAWDVQPPVEVDKHSAERFLWALFNLGTRGKAYRPEYLARDFGSSEGSIALNGIPVLYKAILQTENPKARTFFNQWKVLFGEVCGYDVDDPSEKIRKLAKFYGVKGSLHAAELLFAVHTYYAIFMKLLASSIVAKFHGMPGDPLSRLHAATTPTKFKTEMEDLEKGAVFRHFKITNFLEGDLFAWYLPVWSTDIYAFLRAMVEKLDGYNPQTLAEEPTVSRDLLKKLYQELFPKSVRHDLGEYYTPDWLAEHTLNEIGHDGDPDTRFLDPACGSGTFLVLAINRIRNWYDENRERVAYEQDELCRKILANCIGFDLNPLAVMAARTNYLIAIRGLITGVEQVEIPVYMCDSVTTPFNVGGVLFEGIEDKVKKVPSAVGPFEVPIEVVMDREILGKYCDIIEQCVANTSSETTFVQRCEDEAIPFLEREIHLRLFRRLVQLNRENRNGVWSRIIKNSFAPVFVGRTIDLVVGNPPWVNYENLPAEYRTASARVWEKYRLFPKGGWRARFAKGNTELAMVFVYAAMDNYLRHAGKLGFVITQSVLQSKDSGRGFRAFRINFEKPIHVRHVDDMTALQPFEGATNRTAVFKADLNKETKYPVPYTVWSKRSEFDTSAPLADVLSSTERSACVASPVGDSQSPWMILPDESLLETFKKLSRGVRGYRAWKGTDTRGGNGIFWLQLLKHSRGVLFCRNTPEHSKKDIPERPWGFEPDLIYPLLRGRETGRWHASPALCLLFTHRGESPIPQEEIEAEQPKTWGYLKSFEAELKKRRTYDLSRKELPFWSLFETGSFLTAPYKVVWKEIASGLTCAVVDAHLMEGLTNKTVIPDHKLIIVPFKEKKEAHYLCAALNSSVARFLAKTYIVGTQISTHVLDFVRVRPFDAENETHVRLSELSIECHKAAKKGDTEQLSELESQVDETAGKFWGLTKKELRFIKSLQPTNASDREDSDE